MTAAETDRSDEATTAPTRVSDPLDTWPDLKSATTEPPAGAAGARRTTTPLTDAPHTRPPTAGAALVDPAAPDLPVDDLVVTDPVLPPEAAGSTASGSAGRGTAATADSGAATGPAATGQPDPVDDEIRDPQTGEPDRYVPAREAPEIREIHEVQEVREQRTGRHAAPEPLLPPTTSGADFPLWADGQQTREGRRTRAERRGRTNRRDTRRTPTRQGTASRRARSEPRRPGGGLVLLVVLALVAAFFGWVGAEPFWLSVGHSDRGTLTVTRCTGAGISKRCVGDFTAAGRQYTVRTVALSGAPDRGRPGATLASRMVSERGRQAYAGDDAGLLLRWALPLVLVLLLGLLIAAVTGARRLAGRHRLAVVGLSVLGPLVLTGGLLAVTW